jgi:hypothetical protein
MPGEAGRTEPPDSRAEEPHSRVVETPVTLAAPIQELFWQGEPFMRIGLSRAW